MIENTRAGKWSVRKFGCCGEFLSGGTPDRSRPEYWNGTIPWISAKSLKVFDLFDSDDRVTEVGAAAGTKTIPQGALLFVVRGMSLANEFRVGVAARPLTFNQDLRGLIPASDVDPRYIAHFLRASESRILSLVDHASHGTARLTSDRLDALDVPLPPLVEQRQIAEVLDRAEALRAKRRAALAQLDTLTQAVFLDLFGDAEENPKRWPVRPVSDYVAGFQGGKSIEAESGEAAVTRNRVLKVSAVTGMKFLAHESKPVPDSYGPPPEHFARAGDLLFSRANTTDLVGAVAYVNTTPPNVLLPDKLWRFVWRHPVVVEPLFVWALFQTPALRREIGRRATGTSGSMKNISQEKVFGISTIFPPLPLQRDFARRIAAVERLKSAHRASLAEMDALFASLQHGAFRGEL